MLCDFISEPSLISEDQYPYLLKSWDTKVPRGEAISLVTHGVKLDLEPTTCSLVYSTSHRALKQDREWLVPRLCLYRWFSTHTWNAFRLVIKNVNSKHTQSSAAQTQLAASPALTQILTSDSVEVKVNAEIIARISKVWDRDAIRTIDDTSFVIIL